MWKTWVRAVGCGGYLTTEGAEEGTPRARRYKGDEIYVYMINLVL